MRKTCRDVSCEDILELGDGLTHALRWREKRVVRREREVFVLEKFVKRESVCSSLLCLTEMQTLHVI
jgi:hypothetical protein